ncbi:MAG TPA: hypothetical protein PK878_18690, partial [bacterium]|nr:hypothetical protein [bacterium]
QPIPLTALLALLVQAREGGNEEKIMVDYLMIVAGIEAINIIDKDKNLLFLFTQIRVISRGIAVRSKDASRAHRASRASCRHEGNRP